MADVIEITAEVRGRELRLTSIPMMPSGSRNHLRVRIAFDAEWEGTTKTLVAYRDLSHPYHVPLGMDGTALIPHEVLAEQGVVYLGVFGIAGDQRITSTIVRYGVNEGALTEGLQPSDPTPEMWEQLIAAVNEVRQAAESAMRDAQTAAQGAQRSEQAAAGSATQAEGAATRAETAADAATTAVGAAETAKTDAQASAAEATKSATAADGAATRAENAATEVEQSAQQIAGAIDRLVIHETAAGNPTVIRDSADWQMEGLRVYGQSEQAGVPSPESPQEIVSKTVTEISVTGDGNAQTITLSAPVILRGVPVTTGGNVTIDGKQYIADRITERDGIVGAERRVKLFPLTGDEMWYTWGAHESGNIGFFSYHNHYVESGKINSGQALCTIIPNSGNAYGGAKAGCSVAPAPAVRDIYIIVSVPQSSLADVSTKNAAIQSFKDLLKKLGNVEFLAMLYEPSFEPLPEPDQQAIRALRTYHGNTVVTTGAWTETDYIADPKLYIDGKVTSLVTAYMQSIPVTIPLLDEEVVENER